MMRALLGLVFAASRLIAASATDQLVGEYEPLEPRSGWPMEVQEILLDPARKVGWKTQAPEGPNDLEEYAFAVRNTRDVQRVIDALGKVKNAKCRVSFNPGRGPRGLGDFRPGATGREWGAVLSFSNLEAVAVANSADVEKGGPAIYAAGPTVLEIYLGTADVDLGALKIPRHFTIGTQENSPFHGKDYPLQVRKIQVAKWRMGNPVKKPD